MGFAPKKKLFLVICNSQTIVDANMMWSLLFNLVGSKYPVQIYRASHPWDIVRNNQGIQKFLESDADIMVKMDVDQIYPPNYFSNMVPLVDEYKVIGPVIYDRHSSSGYRTLAFDSKSDLFGTWLDVSCAEGIREYNYTHTNNFYAREVFENIPKPWYEAHATRDGLDRANHVDYDLLDKIKDSGYSIYLNHEIVVKHIAYIGVDKEFHDVNKRGRK